MSEKNFAQSVLPWVSYAAYRVGDKLAQHVPPAVGERGAQLAANRMLQASDSRRRQVERNLQRIYGGALSQAEMRAMTADTFQNYARYWYELFALGDPRKSRQVQVECRGLEHLEAATTSDRGAILAIPHLGNNDLSGGWLAQQGYGLTVVAEALQPPAMLNWFLERRRQIGMEVVVLGDKDSRVKLATALKIGRVVGLLCDRDISGNGTEVKFFGEQTTVPSGPAVLAMRSDVQIVPVGAYFEPDGGHSIRFLEPIVPEQQGRLADRVQGTMQTVTNRLEDLIRVAPDNWLMMQPNWPSDIAAEAQYRSNS